MDFQQRVDRFVRENALQADLRSRLLDLVSEVGEAAKAMLKASRYGEEPFAPTDNWREEMGDILFSLACLANLTGTDLETELSRVMEKYERRLGEQSDAGSGR